MGSVAGLWRGRIAGQRRSGLSIAAFCDREGFSTASFYQWRRRLGRVRRRARPVNRERQSPVPSDRRAGPLFVPIALPRAEAVCSGVRIELPGGAIVAIPDDASADLLTRAMSAAIRATRAMPPGSSAVATGEESLC
jgi:hypothetical protein